MAGLYITIGQSDARRLEPVADYMRFSDESQQSTITEDFGFVWLSYDEAQRFGPASDPETGAMCVISGRLCLSSQAWQQAERLPYRGGLAGRYLLERFLNSGSESLAPYSGAAAVCIWDPRDKTIHLWTDQFGYHPLFVAGLDPEKPTVFTTFPDAINADPAIELKPDHVSMAEFLRAWRITPPHTYYENVKHAGAAMHWAISAKGISCKQTYWRPFESGFFSSIREAADELASAIRLSVKERTAVARHPVFFVSGGADSRVMLFAADDPARVDGVNLFERPTNESRIAQALCERIGAQYVPFQRDNDYYPRLQSSNVRWSGAMWCMEDNHYSGVRELVGERNGDLVMTACTTDWLFKGYGLERTHRKLLGKNLPIKRFLQRRVNGFLPNTPSPSPPKFSAAIDARMDSWFEGCPTELREDRDFLAVEDRRIRPSCYTVSVSGPIMYRIFPYDTFLADSRVAECYGKIKAAWKLNGEVWGLAAAKVCETASDIEDANYGWSVNAGTAAKLYSFSKGWLRRRLFERSVPDRSPDDHPPSSASWPEFGWYARHSKRLQDFWYGVPQHHREQIGHLAGSDPWNRSLEDWASDAHRLFRMLTLLQHWEINESTVPNVTNSSSRLGRRTAVPDDRK